MNKHFLVSCIAALGGLAALPQPARAGDEAWAAIGGFIGGVIVGSAVRDHDHRSPPVDYGRGPVVRGGARIVIETAPRCRGHYDWIEVRTWVSGRWIVGFDDCGRRFRTWTPGHYIVRRERVWVDASACRSHDRFASYDRR